ncbi:MAG: triple tyrosine motif-containing protein [Cytophagales bacterium]|nr:triple tyrosine motif-containing protein [Cytophagales bacterium]
MTFRFKKINKKNPDMIRYKYKLDNWDSKWSADTQQNSVTYSKLLPGAYTFRVKSTNGDNQWNDRKLLYSFTIDALLYQRTWFRILALVFLITVIFLFFYLSTDRNLLED